MSAHTLPRGFSADPFEQFRKWESKSLRAGSLFTDVMILATATRSGMPSARAVLFKGLEQGTFRFFTNYKSRKGRELSDNPTAAAVFLWSSAKGKGPDLQVRIEGEVRKIARKASEEYFHSRERGSQVAAWISLQSSPVPNFEFLKASAAEMADSFAGRAIPCPPFWGGYAITPRSFEFWRAGKYRLNFRVRYLKKRSGWRAQVLAP